MGKELLSDLLEIGNKSVVSIIGCGGKTTTMFLLGEENKDKRVLLTTTTKIVKPNSEKYFIIESEAEKYTPRNGITVLGNYNKKTNKLSSVSSDILSKTIKLFDLTIIEADGSKGLPLKWWNETEPIIIPETTHTILIITLSDLGKEISSKNVHRLDLFLENTNSKVLDKITNQHFIQMIEKMVTYSKGKVILLINKIDNENDFKKCNTFITNLEKKPILKKLNSIICFSGKNNTWQKHSS